METNQITPEELAELRELCEKATPGPWEVDRVACTHVQSGRRGVASTGGYSTNLEDWEKVKDENEDNAKLIAASRTALPRLLDEVERLRKVVDQAIEGSQVGVKTESELCLGWSTRNDIEHEIIRFYYGFALICNAPELYEELKRRGL